MNYYDADEFYLILIFNRCLSNIQPKTSPQLCKSSAPLTSSNYLVSHSHVRKNNNIIMATTTNMAIVSTHRYEASMLVVGDQFIDCC